MGSTKFESSNALTQEAWAKKTLVETKKDIYFRKFWSTDPTSFIMLLNDLEDNPGDVITYPLLMALTGSGVEGDGQLEGEEEAMVYYSDDVTLTHLRHAILIDGLMTEKRVRLKMRSHAKMLLARWLAEKLDLEQFTKLTTSCSYNMWGGDAVSTATIASDDKMTLALAAKVATAAKTNSPKIPPVRIEGKSTYAVVMHPHVAWDVKQGDTNFGQAHREASVRGNTNPVFTGALGYWDGVVLHDHENVTTASNWGGGAITGAINLMLGAAAGVFAFGKRPYMRTKGFDYENQTGFAIGVIRGVNKSMFNSSDYSVVAINTYRTNVILS